MPQWLQNNLQTIIYILVIAIPAVSQGIKVLADKKRQAEARRMRNESLPSSPTSSQTGPQTIAQRSEVSAQNREPATIQDELASQRQAQIEMWKAREAAMRGQRETLPAQVRVSAEDELARRRRAAMEELRRRQVEVDRLRSQRTAANRAQPQPAAGAAPSTRRQRAQALEAERRRQAAQRGGGASAGTPARKVVQQVVASLAGRSDESPAEPQPVVVPASRTTPIGALMLNRDSLRQAFVMKELLDPPIALRDNQTGATAGYHQPF